MSGDAEQKETQIFLDAYTRYRLLWQSQADYINLAPYNHVGFPYIGTAQTHVFQEIYRDQLREIANDLNHLSYRINQLHCWSQVLELYNENDKMGLLIEFVDPIAIVAYSQPSSLKGRFIYSMSNTSHQANLITRSDWDESKLPDEHRIKFKDLEATSKHWSGFSGFSESFTNIDNEDWRRVTNEFRNRYNHRIAPRFEEGVTQPVRRNINKPDNVCYEFGYSSPLYISRTLSELRYQHLYARECFSYYSDILENQIEAIAKACDLKLDSSND